MMEQKKKKVLTILGGPRRNGITAKMLTCVESVAQNNGFEVNRINLYEKKIAFCTGCRKCFETGECIQKDDAVVIAGMLKDCDIVVLAAPVYWANVPAAVKNLFDRISGTVMEETGTFPKGRLSEKQRFIFLTSCNTPAPFSWIFGQSRGAIKAVDEVFKTAGMKCGGHFVCAGNKEKLPRGLTRRLQRIFR